ncbi:MAG: lamin tail domain-containing protein [Anaerolineae bacterium]|nr:lamin tail domain-containing protein [Anaerolineae bacterium]
MRQRYPPLWAVAWLFAFALGLWLSYRIVVSDTAHAGPLPSALGPQPSALNPQLPALSLGDNLLVNPNFEDGFTQREDGAVRVAVGWQPWYRFDPSVEHQRRPEWSPEYLWLPSIRVLHGDYGQKVFNSWAVHDAGIYQKVHDVPVGARLEFSIWVQIWTSECDDICLSPLDPKQGCRGLTNGDYAVGVGIDPTGAAPVGRNLPLPTTIVWSDIKAPAYDRWVRLSVQAVAQSSTVTVFTRSQPHIAVKHNDSYWDTADLRVVTDAMPPTAGETTLRPAATARVALTQPAATPTPATSPTPTATPTPAMTADPGPAKGCWDAWDNGGFEDGGAGWTLRGPAEMGSKGAARSGDKALALGGRGPSSSGALVAEAERLVYLPPDLNRATLSFSAWRSVDPLAPPNPPAADGLDERSEQSVIVETLDGTPLAFALRPRRVADTDWQHYELDLTAFRGRNLRVRFQVKIVPGDSMTLRVDDVALELCRPDGPQARARQMRRFLPRPDTDQQAGQGVRLGFLRYSQTQPDMTAFPAQCDAVAFEFAQFENFGPPVNLEGWTLADAAGNRYTFPYLVVPRGYQVRVWTGPGLDFIGPAVADLHAAFGGQLWDDMGDTLTLRDAAGKVVTTFSYEWED